MSERAPIWRKIAAHGGLAVLLIRHGQTEYNASKRFCGGGSDPPLDEAGREQARALAERLAGEVDRVFASPLLRAIETARALAEPTSLAELRELDQGELEGQDIATTLPRYAEFFRAWRRDPSEVAVPGGETMNQLADRMLVGMRRVAAIHEAGQGRVVAVVSHQMAQAAFVCRALELPLARWHEFELGNARAHALAWDGRAWSLLARDV
ncbi:histidine phosphatase family protein [Nannocystaceae bacterium ST9]